MMFGTRGESALVCIEGVFGAFVGDIPSMSRFPDSHVFSPSVNSVSVHRNPLCFVSDLPSRITR